jgi:catecholate siderophore receptor
MHSRIHPLRAAILLALGVPATHAVAQDYLGNPPTELGDIEVRASKRDVYTNVTGAGGKGGLVELRDVPQSVTVINRVVMDSQAAVTLKDALRNVPGITLSSGEGGNIGDNINIRGYSARTDLFLDGFRDRGHYARETFFLEAVEVLKGPSSMLFGRGSTGGVINQVSKQAELRDFTNITAAAGTDDYYRTTLDFNQQLSSGAALRIAALGHKEDATRDIVEGERYGVAPSLRIGIGSDTQLSFSGIHQRAEDVPDYGLPFTPDGTAETPARPVDVDMNQFYGFTDDFFDQDVDAANLRIEHKFSEALSVRNLTQYSSMYTHAAPTVFPGVTDTTTGRDRRERKQEDESYYNQTDLVAKFETGGLNHTLVTGFEAGRDNFDRQAYDWTGEPTQDLANPVYGPMPDTVVRTLAATRSDNSAETLALYVNETLELTKAWKLVAGVRRDEYQASAKTIDNATGEVTEVERTDRMTSVRGGVLFQPARSQSYYLSYGTSFNPSAETLTISAANATLEPEENRSFEAGAKWELAEGKLAITTALFRVEKTNARSIDPLTGLTRLDGNTRVDGLELSASGQLLPNWQIFAGYTWLDGEILELTETAGVRDGNELPNTPEHSASLWTVYGFGDGFEVGGGVVTAGKRYLNTANSALVDSYTRFDATLGYRFENYDLRLNLLNLTDEEYFESASSARATPAKGRSAIASLNYSF